MRCSTWPRVGSLVNPFLEMPYIFNTGYNILILHSTWDTTYLDSLSSLQWLSLSNCRLLGTNCLTYKILHRYYPVLSPHIQPSTRHSHRLLCQNSRINSFRYSFFINAPFLWNDLPIGITSSASFTSFKHALSTHLYASQSN